jgi:hypothetical protein
MFGTFLKKDSTPPVEAPASLPETSQEPEWDSRLQSALGDDTALLALLKESPSIEIKVAAVQSLSGEEALRQAEREFRTHDRRVHSVAKQCYETRIAQRKARALANDVIEAAVALTGESMIPANRLVELDQSWRALDADLLESDQVAKFAGVQARLTERVRDSGERQRAVSRWAVHARQVLANLSACCAQTTDTAQAPHELLLTLNAARDEVQSTHAQIPALMPASGPDAKTVAALGDELSAALYAAALIKARLTLLDELQSVRSQTSAAKNDKAVSGETPLERWHSLAPIPEQRIADALDARFDDWRRGQDEVRQKRTADKRQRTQQKHHELHEERIRSLTVLVSAVEAALADGHVAEAVKQLPALQAAHDRGDAGAELQGKVGALQAEILRLKEWQHWGGGRVRGDLVDEAETLARSVVAAEGAHAAKMPIAQLEKYIEQLRGRWKELDRLGGATGKPLWQRFDAALKSADRPVAAHKARLAEARLENLAARETLLTALDALNICTDESGAQPDWKSNALALSRFQTDWRKLGPLEHTVPHKRLAALTQRMKASVKRVEDPLQDVVRTAQTEREAFVARARELSTRTNERDVVSKLRDLQGQWQRHSRVMPLPHAVEKALWDEFRKAADAVMNQRDAAIKDRNTRFEAGQKEREALLARLQALNPDTPPAEIKRVLAEVTAEWRSCGEVAKDKAARLDARFHELHDAARQYLAGSAQRLWNASCDCLVARLALCAELETSEPPVASVVADIEARWAQLPGLAPRWQEAVQSRFDAGVAQARQATSANLSGKAPSGERLDDLLLQLESALNIPSPAAVEGARRALKLQALKNALEGRKSASPAPVDTARLTAAVLGCTHVTAEQADRLTAVIAALRQAGPG